MDWKAAEPVMGITVFKEKERKYAVVHRGDGGIQVPSLKKDKDIDPRAISSTVRLMIKRLFSGRNSDHDRSTSPSTLES